METENFDRAKTREMLIEHYNKYPLLKTEDIFKYVFQSAFGCEHLASDLGAALAYMEKEYAEVPKDVPSLVEKLDGEYSRVHLSCITDGISAETLAKLFCASAQKEESGEERLKELLSVVTELVESGELPLDPSEFKRKAAEWEDAGYGAVRHSECFREAYRPAYRVVANRYAGVLRAFSEIDRALRRGNTTVAIEGGSASGKSTLAEMLETVYDCNVIHMDDFFLRPEQRTPERFAEVGGNVDRERFASEVLSSLDRKETVVYRPFDCSTQSLSEPVTVELKRLTVVEGASSMHPAFGRYYDLALFLDIEPDHQRERILKRNSPAFAERFFNEWIPLENAYFIGTDIRNRTDAVIQISYR